MKKFNKWLFAFISLFGIVATLNIPKVNAEKYYNNAIWPSEFISNIFIKKVKPNGYTKYQQARFLRRSEDNKYVYCLQPYVEINNNYVYDVARDDYETATNLSKEQWKRVSLLAYYGYEYNEDGYNHNDKKWYVITQVLIWRTTTPDSKIDFTDTLNGNFVEGKFASEIQELENLVANHNKIPKFENVSETLPLGSSITLTDTNGVLSKYSVSSNGNITVNKDNNTITIKANAIGDGVITFTKADTKYETPPIVYFSEHSQNVMRVGKYDPLTSNFKIKVIGGKILINKLDRDTGNNIPSGDATLEGAKFGIYYAETNELLATITTNKDGIAESPILSKIGKMYAKELSSSTGYLVNEEKIYFEITENNLKPEITVYEQVIRRNIELSKFYSQQETGILKPETNIEFGFFDKNNVMVAKVITDSQGYSVVSLPYGKYTVRQLNASPNVEKVKDFEISITEQSTEPIKYTIVNNELTAKLKIVKVDAESNKVIALSGIKFKILDSNNNQICQTITYPTNKKVCEYETDKSGVLYMPYNLSSGTYKIVEIEDQDLKGYLWNSTPLEFSINDKSDFIMDEELGRIIEVKFSNKRVKGQIDIKKIGEDLIIGNGTYSYKEIPLSDVSFDIIANEDIIIGGNKIYSKGDLVDTIKTDANGVSSKILDLGKYCLVEKNSNNNNLVNNTPQCFNITYKDKYTEIVYTTKEIHNYLPKGQVEFTKTDLVSGEPIPDTVIDIYSISGENDENSELVFTGKTDANGKIVIDNLFVGKFKIIEKEANTLYQITDEEVLFEIKENGEIVKATMTNEKIKIEVPNTSDNSLDYIYIIAGILCVGGVGVIIYDKKRKK